MSLDDLVKKERNRVWAYVDKGEPFNYLGFVNFEYFNSSFFMSEVYDFALDSFSYWKKNGVVNAKAESLITTFKMMYDVYEGVCCCEE